jgi:type I restriction enzyme S subunit
MMSDIMRKNIGNINDDIPTGYKKTALGIIPEDWQVVKLGDVAEVTSSKRIFEHEYEENGIPFYRGKEISILKNNQVIEHGYFIAQDRYNELKNLFGIPVKNDILITAVGTLCNVYLVDHDHPFYFKDGNLIWLKNYSNLINPHYLATQLNFLRDDIINNAIGSSQKALTIVVLKNQVIMLPKLSEQQKIAEILSFWDDSINKLEELINHKQLFKKGMMQQIFSQKVRFKADDGSEYPAWEEKKLREIAKIQRGASPRPISDAKWFSDDSEIGWVRISDVTRSSKYLRHTEQYLSKLGVSKSRLIATGSIIMSICATIGKPIYVDFPVCIHDGFVVFTNLLIDANYLYYYLQLIEDNWYSYGQIGSQVNLNTDIVGAELIICPQDNVEQQKIANFLTCIDDEISLLNKQLEQLKLQKKSLMQKLLTGKIRVC